MRSLRFLTITVGALVILSARADVTLAPLFAEATKVIDQIDGDLTLRGLLAVHRLNSAAWP